jgi:hypothetical protein
MSPKILLTLKHDTLFSIRRESSMRVIIELDEKATIAPVQTQPSASEAINAGAPGFSLSTPGSLTTGFADTVNFRDGIDAGGPPVSLLQELQGAGSLSKSGITADEDAGAAPDQGKNAKQ